MQNRNYEITKEELLKFREAGILDETEYRNLIIRITYWEGRQGKKKKEMLAVLSEKYNIAEKTVDKVIYTKRNRRKTLITELKTIHL